MNEEAVLITIVSDTDADGFPTETRTEKTVYVRQKSATRAEFYEALRSGIRISIVFEVRVEDFELAGGATQIKYDGEVYDIVRTYKTGKSMIELMCS